MTLEEVQKIMDSLVLVDGSCGPCVDTLVSSVQKKFPEFIFTTEPGEKIGNIVGTVKYAEKNKDGE